MERAYSQGADAVHDYATRRLALRLAPRACWLTDKQRTKKPQVTSGELTVQHVSAVSLYCSSFIGGDDDGMQYAFL
jgi:hypothetical protein